MTRQVLVDDQSYVINRQRLGLLVQFCLFNPVFDVQLRYTPKLTFIVGHQCCVNTSRMRSNQ